MREATIQQIDTISPIPKADFLELATLKGLGWTFVVKKGDFKPGDPCVYFCIDSELPPEAPWAKFLADKGSTRIKSMRLRGALSQGLALEIDILLGYTLPTELTGEPEDENMEITGIGDDEMGVEFTTMMGMQFPTQWGYDVTGILGVTHYDRPITPGTGGGDPKGGFPGHTPKTDETMLQNIPSVLQEMAGQEIYVAVKCDGTSTTFAQMDGELDICGRNWSMKEWSREDDPDGKPPIHNLYWKMYRKYEIESILNANDGIAIQAEMVGPGIQGNKLGLDEVEIRVFDIWDIAKGQYFDFDNLVAFCQKYKLPMVPLVSFQDLQKMEGNALTVDFWLEAAKGLYEGTKNRREGIVVRTCKAQYLNGVQNRASFKALNNDFLLKDED